MVYRNSWLAGLAALAFAFVQLNELVLPTLDGVPWQYLVLAALALGLIITWTALTYRLKAWLVVLLNAAAALVAIVRVATPETTGYFLPTTESFSVLTERLDSAQRLIRTGVEPVVPEAGVIVIVMLVLWMAGVMLSWGLLRGHPYVALLPPLVLSLQFATMDRRPTDPFTIAAFVALVALVIFAVTRDERVQTSGRMAPRGARTPATIRPGPAAAGVLGLTIAGSLVVVGVVGDSVPDDGLLDWRVDSGLPSDVYGGSLSYNPFVDIRQKLVRGSEAEAFYATIDGPTPVDQVYFRFTTLERYDGGQFRADGDSELRDFDDPTWQDPNHAFAGPTQPLRAQVQIERLVQEWLPAPAVPVAVESLSGEFAPYLEFRPEDGAILYRNRTSHGMSYAVDARIPQPDINVLATDQRTAQLSVTFRAALEDPRIADELIPTPTAGPVRPEPPNAAVFLELPDNDPNARIAQIRALAVDQTAGLETDFERGLALEAFLRTFDYSTDIDPGHSAQNVADWLLDPNSPSYRTGYCENFSTAMAVMARTLGIHSRVVLGFTPGDRTELPNTVAVRDRNAHAWVELWMPSQGWVRFDPTPRPDDVNPSTSRLTEERLDFALAPYLDVEVPEPTDTPGGTEPILPVVPPTLFPTDPGSSAQPASGGAEVPSWLVWVLGAIGLIVLLLATVPVFKVLAHRRRIRQLRNGDITSAWEDIVLRLGDLGRPIAASRTPAEIAGDVDETMEPLAAVYGRALYGPPGGIAAGDIAVAEKSLRATRARLAATTTRARRLRSWYRASLPGRPRSRRVKT